MNKWVQHKSGQGDKWQVVNWTHDTEYYMDAWAVNRGSNVNLVLPKSEYIECDMPEVWEECTREVIEPSSAGNWLSFRISPKHDAPCKYGLTTCELSDAYRWAWRDNALVIERKKS